MGLGAGIGAGVGLMLASPGFAYRIWRGKAGRDAAVVVALAMLAGLAAALVIIGLGS